MNVSIDNDKYIECQNIEFKSKFSNKVVSVSSNDVIKAVVASNIYFQKLIPLFKEIGFDVYEILGQRNLSGFVGEVFSRTFEKSIEGFKSNPHADGRPDILDLTSKQALVYFNKECLLKERDGSLKPNRATLAPFKYGGLEVKCSIGISVSKYKELLLVDTGQKNFNIGMSRIKYLQSITYWGHHTSCENLVGLYYDYLDAAGGAPQIMVVMHSILDPDTDWQKVSIGKIGSKKTSNTSLTSQGRLKMYSNVITVVNDETYINKLKEIGLKI